MTTRAVSIRKGHEPIRTETNRTVFLPSQTSPKFANAGIMSDQEEPIDFPYGDLSRKVDEAAQRAVDLVEKYSDPDAPEWKCPEGIYRELDEARGAVTAAWQNLLNATADKKPSPLVEEDFRAAYMDMITDAFGDCLHDLQQNSPAAIDIDVLVECLQSGMDIMTQDEKELFMMEYNGEMDEVEGNRSIHEIRREMLGFVNGPLETST